MNMDDIVDINTLFGPLPVGSSDLTVDVLLALMKKHKVGAACTLSTLGLLLDPAIGNAATRAACSEHPTLLPVATFNPTMFFGDTAPLQRLKADGFVLLRFFPTAQGWPMDYTPFQALVASLQPMGLPMMINVERVGEITTLTHVLEGYGGPVVLAGVDISTLSEAIAALRRHANWHIELSRLLAPGSIKLAADNVGIERLLFGTSAPSHPIASALHTLQHAGLADDARRQILGANSRRLLNGAR
jgi:hypothetical protein